ncbi:MAG: phage minor head protein [Flavobacteriaceae bacterium]
MDTAHAATVQKLKQNIYKFSGAKTYQQLAEMNSHLVDEKGKIRSFSAFKRKVGVVHKKYNQNYLQAEYQTAKRSAQAARQWKGFEANKDLFPNLKYMTVGDDKVRHDHARLHGIIKPVGHPFWDTHYPPNGWRCRCYAKPTSEGSTNQKIDIQPDKGFGLNVGKTNKMFDENNHPYFTFPKKDAKSIKKAFEKFKLITSYGKARYVSKNGAKVFVHPFADAADLPKNYISAVKMADAGISVKIRPDIDTNFIVGAKNPEYVINGVFADRVGLKNFNNLGSTIRDKKKQSINKVINPNGKKYSIVFDLEEVNNPNLKELGIQLNRSINKDRGRSVKSIYVIHNNKVVELTREDILKNDYSKLYKIQ